MYKVFIKVYNDNKYYTNGLVFDTYEKANNYALDLYSKWTQAEAFEVRFVNDTINN